MIYIYQCENNSIREMVITYQAIKAAELNNLPLYHFGLSDYVIADIDTYETYEMVQGTPKENQIPYTQWFHHDGVFVFNDAQKLFPNEILLVADYIRAFGKLKKNQHVFLGVDQINNLDRFIRLQNNQKYGIAAADFETVPMEGASL